MQAWLGLAVALAGAAAGAPSGDASWSDVPEAQRCARMTADLGQAPRKLHLRSGVVRFLDLAPEPPDPDLPWLLIHGYGGDLCSYGPMLARLAGRHRVLALDLPGFGESASTDEHYTIDSYVQTLREFLARIEVDKVHLVCHSLGGHVCLGAALTTPATIATMTLIDTAGIYERADFIKHMAKHKGRVNLGQMAVKRGRSLIDWTIGEQEFLRRFIAADPAIWTAVSSFRSNYREQIGALRTPTLILWGMDDSFFPVEDAAFLKENVPGAELHIVEGAGHCPNETHASIVVDLIEAFVRQRKGQGP